MDLPQVPNRDLSRRLPHSENFLTGIEVLQYGHNRVSASLSATLG
jgi:hypothetical protein